jgi:hypothetical protein
MEKRMETPIKPLLELSAVNGTIEVIVNVSKMLALELEGGVVATKNASEDALIPAISRILQFAHPLLQSVVGFREALQDCFRVGGSTSDVIAGSVRIDDGELVLVGDVCIGLRKGQCSTFLHRAS